MDHLAKARRNLTSCPSRPVVLVLGGSFNPIHNGHLRMFDAAAEACKREGLNVVGGFLAVASNEHVRRKAPPLIMPADLRIQACAAATRSSPHISVLPEVEGSAREAAARISRQLGSGVQGLVLCGADLLQFKGTYDRADVVVVQRDSAPYTSAMQKAREALPRQTIVASGGSDFSGTSSTVVRAFISTGNWDGLADSRMLDADVLSMLRQFASHQAAEIDRARHDGAGGFKRSKAKAKREYRGAAATTHSEFAQHALQTTAVGTSQPGGGFMKASSITDVVIGAVKQLGGLFFGDSQCSDEQRRNHRRAERGGGAAANVPHSFDDDRSKRARVWAETHAFTLQGSYLNQAGVSQPLAHKISRPFKVDCPAAAPNRAASGSHTRVCVENRDCLHSAQERADRGLRTCVLDAGSGGHFGGGYQRGASAQEEDLCRRSCLAEMADKHLDCSLPQFYPLRASCVMVPLVPVFRDDRHARVPYAVLDRPFVVDIGIVAAINRPTLLQQGAELRLSPIDAAHTRACIRNFFVAAQQAEAQALVLVPLGCGAFCNPPGHICDIFLDVLREFDGVFQEVVFAILDDKNTGKAHNPDGNFAPFKARIERHYAAAAPEHTMSKQ